MPTFQLLLLAHFPHMLPHLFINDFDLSTAMDELFLHVCLSQLINFEFGFGPAFLFHYIQIMVFFTWINPRGFVAKRQALVMGRKVLKQIIL